MDIDIIVDASWFIIVALLIYTLGFIEIPIQLHPRALSPRAGARHAETRRRGHRGL